MTFVIDIDDTIVACEKVKCSRCGRITYENPIIDEEEIERINALYYRGETIILYTGRNWDAYLKTVEMLSMIDVKYHELVMGKPQGIYVDKDARTSLKEFA